MIEVLLVSPTDPEVPTDLRLLVGGENTYTLSLLKNPPQGVRYTYFWDALKKQQIKHTFWQSILSLILKFRLFPPDAGYQCFKLIKQFDLIHCHAYTLKIDGKIKPPVVLSTSSSTALFLKDYLHWPEWRINLQLSLRIFVHKYLKLYDPEVYPNLASNLIVFSKLAKRMHLNFGQKASDIEVIYPGLKHQQKPKSNRSSKLKKLTLLFAGVWFERKGGRLLLQAYQKLKLKYNQLKLIILGPLPKDIVLKDKDIFQKDFVNYNQLVNKYYRLADVLVLVPLQAEGFGMVVLEAMALGIPAIVSRVHALPELVLHKETGLVVRPGSVNSLIRAIEALIIDKRTLRKLGRNAYTRYQEYFSSDVSNGMLYKKYKEALHV